MRRQEWGWGGTVTKCVGDRIGMEKFFGLGENGAGYYYSVTL